MSRSKKPKKAKSLKNANIAKRIAKKGAKGSDKRSSKATKSVVSSLRAFFGKDAKPRKTAKRERAAAKPGPMARTKGKGKPAQKPVAKAKVGSAPKGRKKGRGKAAGQVLISDETVRNGRRKSVPDLICREVACDQLSTSGGYCRLHYIKNWKKIKRRELILKEGKLNRYVEELVAKYPDRYIEAIREDLASDKDFGKVVHELELDENIDEFDGDSDNVDVLIDNMRRDVDDEGETY